MSEASTSAAGETTFVVLLVEDDALIALLLEDEITAAGCEVRRARDGRAAVAQISGLERLDFAVVNLNLGRGPTGQDVISALRSRWAELPVIVVTGYPGHIPQADLRHLGGPTRRLAKPINLDDFRSYLAAVCSTGRFDDNAAALNRRGGEQGRSGGTERKSAQADSTSRSATCQPAQPLSRS